MEKKSRYCYTLFQNRKRDLPSIRHPFFQINKKLYTFGETIGKNVLVIAYKDLQTLRHRNVSALRLNTNKLFLHV